MGLLSMFMCSMGCIDFSRDLEHASACMYLSACVCVFTWLLGWFLLLFCLVLDFVKQCPPHYALTPDSSASDS